MNALHKVGDTVNVNLTGGFEGKGIITAIHSNEYLNVVLIEVQEDDQVFRAGEIVNIAPDKIIHNFTSDEEIKANQIVKLLGLKKVKSKYDDLYDFDLYNIHEGKVKTTKTAIGIYRTIKRIIDGDYPIDKE